MKYPFDILPKILILAIITAILAGYFLFNFLKEPELTDFPHGFKPYTAVVLFNLSLLYKPSKNITVEMFENAIIESDAAYDIRRYFGGTVEIVFPDHFDDFKDKYNLILVGTPENNVLIKKVCDAAGMVEEIRDSEEKYGLLEIFRNPWNPLRKIIIITGSDGIGVKSACDTLISGKGLKGKRMVIKPEIKTISGRIYPSGDPELICWFIASSEGRFMIWGYNRKGMELITKAGGLISQGKDARVVVKGYLTTMCVTKISPSYIKTCCETIIVIDYNFIGD